MQSAATRLSGAAPERGDIPVFSVVIAFEDFDTGRQAKRAYDFLVANLSHEWRVANQMWKFEMFSIKELREMAAKDISQWYALSTMMHTIYGMVLGICEHYRVAIMSCIPTRRPK